MKRILGLMLSLTLCMTLLCGCQVQKGNYLKPVKLTESERDHIAAVIALALAQHELEVVHDDETDVITLSHHDTAWNAPARLMNPWKAQ